MASGADQVMAVLFPGQRIPYNTVAKVVALNKCAGSEAFQIAVDGGQRQGGKRRLHLCKDVLGAQWLCALTQNAQHGLALFGIFHGGTPFNRRKFREGTPVAQMLRHISGLMPECPASAGRASPKTSS